MNRFIPLLVLASILTVSAQNKNSLQNQYFNNLKQRAEIQKKISEGENIERKKIEPFIYNTPAVDDSNFVEIYFEGFEDGLNGWTVENLNNPSGPTYWHASGLRGKDSETSAASNDSTTGISPNNYFEALVSPPIELPEDGSFILVEFDFFNGLAAKPRNL